MREEKLEVSTENMIGGTATMPSVDRVGPNELDTVAQILSIAYAEYPIHTWGMPKSNRRRDDSMAFFKFYLRRMRLHNWDIFATSDRSAVLVTRLVRYENTPYSDSVRHLPTLIQTKSPVNDFFQWIETFRPKVDHRYPEFFGCLPNAPRGTGFYLYATVLKIFNREGFPLWTWTANPMNLPFFRRLGFEIGEELRRDNSTPPVTIIYRQA